MRKPSPCRELSRKRFWATVSKTAIGSGSCGLHPQAEHHVLHLLAVDRVHRRVAGAELAGEIVQRARAAALADGQYVLSGEVACGRVEAFRDELDMILFFVRQGEQLIFDIGDADVARAEILDRIRALGPHLGVGARREQALLDLGRELGVLAALDGNHLHAPHVALFRGLPYDPAVLPLPAAVIDLDRHPRPHQVVQQQGQAQPHRAASGHRDVQGGGRAHVLAAARLGGGQEGGGRTGGLEAERLIADHDLVAGLELMRVNEGAIDPGAIGAAEVAEDIAACLGPQLGMDTRGQRAGQAHRVLGATAERYRRGADGEPLSVLGTAEADNCRFHRIPPNSVPALAAHTVTGGQSG